MADSQPTETMSVVTVTPLTVVADGATVASPCESLSGTTYIAGDRVSVQVRDPQYPLAQGKVEAA